MPMLKPAEVLGPDRAQTTRSSADDSMVACATGQCFGTPKLTLLCRSVTCCLSSCSSTEQLHAEQMIQPSTKIVYFLSIQTRTLTIDESKH